MVKIVIENRAQKVVLDGGTSKTALRIFQEQGVDWMHACGGKGRCTTCRFVVLQGNEQLAPATALEQKMLATKVLQPNERLSCQAVVLGEIHIRVPNDCKLPHLHYTG